MKDATTFKVADVVSVFFNLSIDLVHYCAHCLLTSFFHV